MSSLLVYRGSSTRLEPGLGSMRNFCKEDIVIVFKIVMDWKKGYEIIYVEGKGSGEGDN